MLFVTGASGVLGPAVLRAFGADRCLALQHRTAVAGATVAGDLTQVRLGLSAGDYRDLLGRIDGVLHAGAITSAAWPARALERANVDGTRNAVRLAEDAGVPLHHISSFYVRGRNGTHSEEPTNAYQATKRAAEDIAATARVPTAIYRIPILIGDAATGVTTRFQGQGLYSAAKVIVGGNAHLLPAPTPCWVDFLPRDHVAQCLQVAVDAGLTGIYWITAGTRAVSLETLVDACVDVAVGLGREAVRPKIVSPDVVDRLILPAFGEHLPTELRMQLRIGNSIALGMANSSFLPDSRDSLPAGVRFPPVPDLPASLGRSLEYWAANTRLRAPVPIS